MLKKLFIILLIVNCTLPIVKTQWVQQTLPVNKPITGIKFVDSLKGWACTGYGSQNDSSYILYTTNGGTTWLIQLSVYNIFFTDLNIPNTTLGFASSYDNNISLSKLFTTNNGGINWTPITMVPNMLMEDIQFLNKDSAWECGTSIGPDVRTTTDGGNTWIVRTNGITQATQRIFFLNYSTGFCGAQTRLYITTDAGLNWILNSNYSQFVEAIFFLNNNNGWLGLSNGRIAMTTNGGANWLVQQPFPLNGNNTTDVYFSNNNTGYAGTGWFQKILKTTNGGINWGYQLVPTGSVRISVIDTQRAWAADLGVSTTINGGGPIAYLGVTNISTEVPNLFKLYQNYPNPFNSQTNIAVDISNNFSSGNPLVKLVVYNVLGKELETLIDQQLSPGTYQVDWNANNYPSGIYFYRLISDGNIIDSKKMILIK